MTIRIIDVIPASDSAETGQNSEPSIAVNPVNTDQIIAGSFAATTMSFFLTLDGGTTWSHYDDIDGHAAHSMAWSWPYGNRCSNNCATVKPLRRRRQRGGGHLA